MPKGVITILFDSGQMVKEPWLLPVGHQDLPDRLKRIAQARLPLLGSCTRIAKLKVARHPPERMNWQGTGGPSVLPRESVKMTADGRSSTIQLRWVPREVFAKGSPTATGLVAFRELSKTVSECGCLVIRDGEPFPITELQPFREILLSHVKGRPATLSELTTELGKGEANQFWAELKKRRGEM